MNRMQGDQRGGEFHYLRMMAEEIEKSYPPGSFFTEESLTYVNRKFRASFSVIYTDGYLKHKFRDIKKRYDDFSRLLNEEGIHWDRSSNSIYGPESLLQEKCQDRFAHGVYHGEEHYDLMCQIFESGVSFLCN